MDSSPTFGVFDKKHTSWPESLVELQQVEFCSLWFISYLFTSSFVLMHNKKRFILWVHPLLKNKENANYSSSKNLYHCTAAEELLSNSASLILLYMLNIPLECGREGESAFRIQIISLADFFTVTIQSQKDWLHFTSWKSYPTRPEGSNAASIKRNETTRESIATTKAYHIKGHLQLITVLGGS